MHWVEHGADMVVGRDGGHAKQALAVRHLPPFLQCALVGEERLALHEEQRKGRQADIRHAVGHLAAPLVGIGRAGRANALQKGLKHLHADLNHTSSQSETHSSHQPFRIAGFPSARSCTRRASPSPPSTSPRPATSRCWPTWRTATPPRSGWPVTKTWSDCPPCSAPT